MTIASKLIGKTPAFPLTIAEDTVHIDTGMDLRDYFAAMAMQGFFANSRVGYSSTAEIVADSYVVADEMLRARR